MSDNSARFSSALDNFFVAQRNDRMRHPEVTSFLIGVLFAMRHPEYAAAWSRNYSTPELREAGMEALDDLVALCPLEMVV